MFQKFACDKDALGEKIRKENSARWAAYGPGANGQEGEAGAATYREMRVQGVCGLSHLDAIGYEQFQKERHREKARAKRRRINAGKWV